MATFIPIILSNWCTSIDGLHFSATEFYSLVEQRIKDHKIPETSVKKISLSQTGILSAKREYLRVNRKDYSFDICAAPFGTQFFVSWWFGERAGFLKELLAKIPVIGPLFIRYNQSKTYYQLDTEAMFREAIRQCVLDAIDSITKEKGLRALSDLDRQPQKVASK